MPYGQEVIIDLCDCDPTTYDTREKIEGFLWEVCDLIGAEPKDLHFWDYAGRPEEYAEAEDRFKGTSAVQFILTSSLVIHALDVLKTVYLNVFSCAPFDAEAVVKHAVDTFSGTLMQQHGMDRL